MECKYQLIMVICNNGYAGDIVDTVRKEGATGATILHARGSATDEMEKFFGIVIHPEKELVLMVTSNELKNQLMKVISATHGITSDARAICFSIPVEDGIGFNF